MHLLELAFMVMPMGRLHHDRTARDPVKVGFQFFDFLADAFFNRFGVGKISECDGGWNLHGVLFVGECAIGHEHFRFVLGWPEDAQKARPRIICDRLLPSFANPAELGNPASIAEGLRNRRW
jgi:hypothetical protein